MSKSLELTIYPRPRMKAHHQGPAPYLDMASGTLTSEHAANMLAGAKRLTEAELCAEFEAARCDFLLMQHTGGVWTPLRETWPMNPQDTSDRVGALMRFATHPHYFEATEPESDTE